MWRHIKRWRARQFAEQAMALIERQQWNEAATKIRSAFNLSQTDLKVWRANARLLSRTGRGSVAVEWWEKIAQSQPLSLDDHRDYAIAALSAQELDLAAVQLRIIFYQSSEYLPSDQLLEGQVDALRGYNSDAFAIAQNVLHNPQARPRDHLAANLLTLAVANRGSREYSEAAAQVFVVAKEPDDHASLDALTILGRQLAAIPPAEILDRPLAIPLPEVPARSISAIEIADLLERHPRCRPFHKMLALELRARAEPARQGQLIAQALDTYRDADDETLGALGAWLYTRGRFQLILKLISIDHAALNRQLMLERIDAMASLKQLKELEDMLLVGYPVLPQSFQHMYLAVVRSQLGETTAAANEWQRAVDAADTVEDLLAVADFAQKHGPPEIVDQALARAIVKQPGLRSAYVTRLRLLELSGPTDKAHSVAQEMVQLWPDDVSTRMHEIYLRLLLEPSAQQAKASEREAEALSASVPAQGVTRSTIALARLRQGRPAAALEALSDSANHATAENVSWPIYAAALAANGWRDKARAEAEKLATAKLLPEERALIAPLLKTE